MSRVEIGAGAPEAEPPVAGDVATAASGALAEPAADTLVLDDDDATDDHRHTDLPGTPSAVSLGRDFTRQALLDWGWIPDSPGTARQTVAADILLVISEILANAVMHAGGARGLSLDSGRSTGALRLEVADGDPTLPAPPPEHRPGLPGGHGLLIVEKLSDRWGVIPAADGKIVWAEVDLARLREDLTAPPES